VSLTCREPLPTIGDPVGRRWPRLLRPISWALAPRKRGVASAFQAEVAAPGHLIPPFLPRRRGDRLARGGTGRTPRLRRPPRHTHEKDGGMPRPHPGPEGRGYQRPRPMNRPDPPHRVPVSAPRPTSLRRDQGPGTGDREGNRQRREPGTGNREPGKTLRISDCGLRIRRPRQAVFSGEPKATAFSGTGYRQPGGRTDHVRDGTAAGRPRNPLKRWQVYKTLDFFCCIG
jgi:hypothetical protein